LHRLDERQGPNRFERCDLFRGKSAHERLTFCAAKPLGRLEGLIQ
jgi:hypothetical protein